MTDKYENDDEEYDDEEATSESEVEEYEDEAEDAEASGESEEESESASEDSVASWGYEEKKSRFSKEMLAGFAAIGVLVVVFGIVVYKKMPGTNASGEVVVAPGASLGNPESGLGNPAGTPPGEDPNDPFREGAENGVVVSDLGTQSEPGSGDGTLNASLGGEFVDLNPALDGSTNFGTGGMSSETASLFPNEANGGQGISNEPFGSEGSLGNNEPFASNSEPPDLFSGQSEPGLGSNSEPPFGGSSVGTSTATDEFGRPLASNEFGAGSTGTLTTFPGSGPNAFTDSSRPDPFAEPDPLSSTGSTNADSGTSEFGSSELVSNDPFPQDNQLAQNEQKLDGSLSNSFPDDSTSALQPGSIGGSPDFGSSTSNDPFDKSANSTLTSNPAGLNSGTNTSKPVGLLDRKPKPSSKDKGPKNPLSKEQSSDPGFGNDQLPRDGFGTSQPSTIGSEFGLLNGNGSSSGGALDGGPTATSSIPFGSEEPFGATNKVTADNVLRSLDSASPSISNDPFGNPTSTASNDPFPSSTRRPSSGFDSGNGFDSGSSEPTDLFPGGSSEPLNTASNDPFQQPLTSSPAGRSPVVSSSISNDPFGNEPVRLESSTRNQTFASQAGNAGSYTVQEGDSYWNISKKVYGTAKYFQVLADHNRNTIADPQKMKTGAVIQTPDAAVLQGRLKTVLRPSPTALSGRIEASGRADRSGSAGSSSSATESVVVSRRETTPDEQSGILFNEQGYPMFKIGETDTLTSIASDHLGRASRWQQVYNMNRDQLQSPDKLHIGMLLKLPADASRVPLVDRTSSLR